MATVSDVSRVEDEDVAAGDLPSEETASPGSQSQSQSQSLLNSIFFLLSDAKPPTLVAIAGGVVAILYLFLGKLSLLLIGVVSGVVLHAWWEDFEHAGDGSNEGTTKRKRRELGIEVANRLLDWKKVRSRTSLMFDNLGPKQCPRDYSSFEPKTATALTRFTDAIIGSYVL